MMPKFAKQEANAIVFRLDKMAHAIQANHKAWGMPFDTAKALVNALDQTADEVEVATFGAESLAQRQVEVAKQIQARQNGGAQQRTAEVMHREPDEPYMKSFDTNPNTVQIEADEPYMKMYGQGDQSSAVLHGVSTSGRPLTPHKNDSPSPV
jgi:hypothetical protein